tara:strand:- start:828 stop:1718 length:891 start_codon:yes stop_codon:yes gene_type:complete
MITSCKKENTNDNDNIIGKKYAGLVPYGTEYPHGSMIKTGNPGRTIFELNEDGFLYRYDTSVCTGYYVNSILGEWNINNDTIEYIFTTDNIEYTEILGVMTEYNSELIKFYLDDNANSICRRHDMEFDVSDCTYIPDSTFEYKLIQSYIDDFLDNYVLTNSINQVTYLNLGGGVKDLTGIENFKNLTELSIINNNLTSLNLSNNLNLISLNCRMNNLTSLDLRNNPNLINLDCSNNNLTSLDLRNGNSAQLLSNGWNFISYNNPLLNCISVDLAVDTVFVNSWNIDPQHYFSTNCP